MIRHWGLMLLIPSLALAQTAPKTPAGAPAKTTPSAAAPAPTAAAAPATPAVSAPAPAQPPVQVAPDAAVITVAGICPVKPASGECKTVVTRAEFDTLVNTLGVPPARRIEFATSYARWLVFAHEAERQGLADSAAGKELVRMARLQALFQTLGQQMQQKADPAPADVEKQYAANPDRYAELSTERIYIPLFVTGDSKVTPQEMKTFADELRQRAVAGTDFKTLQAEASAKAGVKNPPETKATIPANNLPEKQRGIAQLKLGEVSPVIEDMPALFIYKVLEKKPIPLEKVRDEIARTMRQQRLQEQIDSVLKSGTPSFNQDYFSQIASTAPIPVAPMAAKPGVTPSTAPVVQPHAPSQATKPAASPQPVPAVK